MVTETISIHSKDEPSHGDDAKDVAGREVSQKCVAEQVSVDERGLDIFLNTFREPVIIVDGMHDVVGANQAAKNRVKDVLLLRSRRLVDGVFGCFNSDGTWASRKDFPCPDCPIRSAVTKAFQTGVMSRGVPCCPAFHEPGGAEGARHYLMTRKVGESVFLHIDAC